MTTLWYIIGVLVIILICLLIWQPKYKLEKYTSVDCDADDDADIIALNQKLYPVGTVLITGHANSPAEWICGLENTTWKRLTDTDSATGIDGIYALKSCNNDDNNVGEISGSASSFGDWELGDCELTVDQLPDHTHTISNDSEVLDDTHSHDNAWQERDVCVNVESGDTCCGLCSPAGCSHYDGYHFQGTAPHTHKITTENTGGGHAHSHRLLVGYYKFYVWERSK